MADAGYILLVAPPAVADELLAHMDAAHARTTRQFTSMHKALEFANTHTAQALLCHSPILEKFATPQHWRHKTKMLPLILLTDSKPGAEDAHGRLPMVDDHIALDDVGPGSIARVIDNAINMHRMHAQFQQVLEDSPDGVLVVDAHGDILYANRAAGILLDRKEDGTQGQLAGLLLSTDTKTEVDLANGRTAEVRVVEIEWLGQAALLATLRDITERKQIETRLTQAAERDGLTDLANRSHFQSELSKAISKASEQQTRVAVFFIDMDNFKTVNDQMGHDAGDQLLRTVADRLRAASRADTLVGRLGGDEFIALTRNVAAGAESMIAKRFLAQLNEPATINGQSLEISASIGVATYPECGRNAHTLIMAADAAMYGAKHAGRNRIELFSKDTSSASARRQQLDIALRLALSRNEMSMVYQPLFDIRGDRPIATGCEALLRWTHPELGPIPPNEFIPMAEANGWIDAIGRWVAVEVCTQLSKWAQRPAAEGLPGHASINVSTHQLRDARFPAFMARVLQETGVAPEQVWLEVTETALMHNVDECVAVLAELRAMGLKIAMDDFGTGYSSLAYLQRLPLDIIKIDSAFVRDLGEQANDATIVNSVMQIAQSQHLLVIAEGVETQQELECLQKLGCDLAQGYLLARPMPAGDLGGMLATGT